MGKQISKYEYRKYGSDRLMKPVIFCRSDKELAEKAIAMNVDIAKKLIDVEITQRSFKISDVIDSVIAELPENSTIKEFDVLFNPDYQINVLKLFIAACRKKEFAILWPGTFSEGKLMYARAGYSDFKIYDLDEYDVTCVV
jgi:hypothetical protein